MKLSDQLRHEWSLIDQPNKWTKGEYARDKTGNWVTVTNKSACKFCQEGARRKVLKIEVKNIGHTDLIANNADGLAHNVAKLFGFSSAILLNDAENTTHADMRIYYETMIYIAEQCE
jgi:hypothetical protein